MQTIRIARGTETKTFRLDYRRCSAKVDHQRVSLETAVSVLHDLVAEGWVVL
jgi:hypothetical protein